MTCREIENNLPAYLEDLLSPEEKGRIREHLVSCRQCSKALADLKHVDTLLSDLEEVTPPPWLKQKIMTGVREEAQPEKGFFLKLFSPLHLKIPLSTAALLLISVLAFYVYRGQEPALQKEGIHIALPPPAMEQRIEKQEWPKTAPDRSASSRDASPEAVTSRLASSPAASVRPVLPQEIPPTRGNSPMKPPQTGSTQPADQAVPAPEKTRSSRFEEPPEKEKGKCAIGKGDMAELHDEIVVRGPFPAAEKDGAVALREAERTPGCAAPQPALVAARAGIRAGSKENKAESAAKMADVQGRVRTMPVAEILNLLRQYDAVKIDRRTSGEHEIVTAELPSRQVRPLLQKLETRGLSGKNISVGATNAQQEIVSIRIEIPRKP